MSAPASELRRTPLHGRHAAAGARLVPPRRPAPPSERPPPRLPGRHAAAGARLVPFAGWEMPVQYKGIREEHEAVRERAGVFDVSHMGQIETCGPQAVGFLQHVLTNDVRRIPEGGAQYALICLEDGGIIDDLFTYRLAERRVPAPTHPPPPPQDPARF